MMGGATEHDQAMIWFLERANGGNVLVIRASGSNGYNDYLYSGLGVDVQSVETIVFNSISASEDAFVLDRIAKAEAIWIAGGNQWNYVNYWKTSSVGQLLDHHINSKQAPIGGTSAGMAILGGTYFSAQNGTITSFTALNNPYASSLTLGHEDFLHAPYLDHVITDTHYNDPDRRGRHMAFLARLAADHGVLARGIACDEYTAICIDENGIARTYGEYPAYDENVYFLQANCEGPIYPEVIEPNTTLTWNRGEAAVKVYHIQPDLQGTKTFDLNDWLSGSGGFWENWWVEDGLFHTSMDQAPECSTGILREQSENDDLFSMNEFGDIQSELAGISLELYSISGQLLSHSDESGRIKNQGLESGVYILHLRGETMEQRAIRIIIP